MPIVFTGKGTPISATDFGSTATALGGDVASLWSLVVVETKGFGFLTNRRPQILFERHIFHRRTSGKFDATDPNLSNSRPGGYSGGAAEYDRLEKAMTFDEQAALESASWGLGQVMGFNAKTAGFADVHDMVNAMVAGEGAQLQAVANFILANPPLRAAFLARDWANVALHYNGANFAENDYDTKLSNQHAVFSTPANRPDLDLRTAQACLLYLGFKPGGVDGLIGPRTRDALLSYRKTNGLPPGVLDAAVLTGLRTAANI
jgi:hypothetical protein